MRSWWPPWGTKQEPTKALPPPVAPPSSVDFREELEKQQKARYETFLKLKALKTESARKNQEDPDIYPTPLAYFYLDGVTTKEERGVYAEVLTMLVIKQAAGREDKGFEFVKDAFCTDKHSVPDINGADIIIVTKSGSWIPVQIKRTKTEVNQFREESRRRDSFVPVVRFNDTHSERQLLDEVLKELEIQGFVPAETVGQR